MILGDFERFWALFVAIFGPFWGHFWPFLRGFDVLAEVWRRLGGFGTYYNGFRRVWSRLEAVLVG